MTRITVLQPDPAVPLERFGSWLREAGARLTVVPLWEREVPAVDEVGDGVLLLGGTMSAHDEERHRWIDPLKDLLADLTEIGVPTLGICLGHQLLAEALGGEVTVAEARGGEHGPVVLTWTEDAVGDPMLARAVQRGRRQPGSHSDVVTRLPIGAVELARTDRYPHQAFRMGSAVGVQFHPEASPDLMARWARLGDRDDEATRLQMEDVDAEVERVGHAIAESFAAACAS